MRTSTVTNQEVATKIGLSHTGVSRIRNGDRLPRLATMLNIEKAFAWKVEAQIRARIEDRYADTFEEVLSEYAARATAGTSA